MVNVTDVKVLSGRTVRLKFSDESERTVDLSPFLYGPVFASIASCDLEFAKVRVDPELGTISWPNGADLDPDVLHGDYLPANSVFAVRVVSARHAADRHRSGS